MKFSLFLVMACAAWCAGPPIQGFSGGALAEELRLEDRARTIPEPGRLREYVRRMSEEPHAAGSARSRAVAEYALGLFREFGLDARIEQFEALMPVPVQRTLEMVEPVRVRARLNEVVIPEDKDARDAHQLPPFNAYSADGDVTAPLVYVNYGMPEDYVYLEKQGVAVKGAIVLARYGGGWRGVKPKLAFEHGAVGCIIYSDPRDDGYFQGDMYPKGPYRPFGAVQRGSTLEMAIYPGDPLSPGWASEPGSKRLSLAEAKTLQKIPVLPISAKDAEPLLEHLGGPVAPERWRGALPFTYHLGPGPARVHLALKHEWSTRPLYDVIARIPGAQCPEEWVIYGNHHDAWVNGAGDPASGAAVVIECGRTLAQLMRQGWKPRRTVLLALWDGEEYGLLGSTEWVEKHASELRRSAVAYLNTDMYGKGEFGAGGSPSLRRFTAEVARDIKDPETGRSVLKKGPEEFSMGTPGSGSDYAAFVHHLGVPAVNAAFGGPGLGGTYHSIYDSFDWYSRFGDPKFDYGVALTQWMTIAVLRLTEAPVLPFEFTALAKALDTYVAELARMGDGKLALEPVRKQLARLRKSASDYEKRYRKASGRFDTAGPEQLAAVNAALMGVERAMTTPQGLPGRDWFKHKIFAPGTYTGYSAKSLPGIREAAEAGRWKEAEEQAGIVADVLAAVSRQIDQAAEALKKL
jgi:N-acetylated-alpha-linked acidic dipeptidase